MKKTITLFILLFILSIGQMWAGNRRIYFDYSAVTWWIDYTNLGTGDKHGDGYAGVHCWNNSGSHDYTMDAVAGESNLLYCDIDDSYTDLCFFRAAKDNTWWNKTFDYNGIGSYNRFKVKSESIKDGGIDKFYWADSDAAIRWVPGVCIDGLIDVHNPHNQAFTFDGDDGTYEVTLSAHSTYQFCIRDGSTRYTLDNNVWTSNISEYTLNTSGYDLRMTTAGAGTYTFKYDKSTHKLSVTYPTVTHPSVDYCYMYGYGDWTNKYLNIWESSSGIEGTTWPGTAMWNYFTISDDKFYYFAPGDYAKCEPNANEGEKKTTQNTSEGYGKYIKHDGSSWGWRVWSFTVELDEQATTLTAPSDPTVEFNGATLTNITPPTRVDAFFEGYWSNAACDETQVINRDGSWVADAAGYTSDSKWIHEGGTATLYAKWTDMLQLYPATLGDFIDFELSSCTDQSKALFIDKSRFVDAHPGNRIKIDGPDASVADDAKFFFGDYDAKHVPGSDFRQVPTGSDVLPVYIYLTKEMIDYIKTHDLRIYGQNMTVNRVELEVGRADEYASQPQKVIWMGDFTADDLSTIDMCINQLDVNWTDYQNMIIYHNAGTKDYSFNVRTNWEESGIISFWKDKNHITQEKNFTVVDLVHSNAPTVIGATPDRLFVQRDDHTEGVRTPFTITSIVLEKSNTATAGSTWSDATWSLGHAPTTDECAVITAPMTVNVTDAKAGRVLIDQSSSNTGKLTIQPNKGLDVRLTVKKTTDGSTLETTSPADLVLESSSDGNASLVFTNDDNAATVQMYSKASIPSEDVWNWQFMGIPFTSTNALYSYYGSYLYEWQSDGTWDVVPNGGTMTPFTGYCITQSSATTYTMSGTLNSNSDVNISIPENKEFVMANSWSAPISVCNFTTTTLPLDDKTIYLFNTGFAPKENGDAKQGTAAGTYVAMPINSAIYTGNYLIAPMEGFYVDNRSGSEATITLKYDELVRPSGSHTDIVAGPMHAPRRAQAADDQPAVMKIKATGSRYSERIVILERGDFSAGFDNGWDGKNLNEPGVAPILYALREDGTKDAVSAIPTYEGTVVGFRQGEDNAYTFSFDYDGEDVWYLNDLQELQSTLISEENRYAFTSSASDSEARFIISATPIHKTPTGMETVTGDGLSVTGVRKILINNHLYIIKNGRLYGADGRLVK